MANASPELLVEAKSSSFDDSMLDNAMNDSPIADKVESEVRHLENEFHRRIVQAMVKSHKRQMNDNKLLPPERAHKITSNIQEIEKQLEKTMCLLNESQKQQLELLSRIEEMERLIVKREKSKVVRSILLNQPLGRRRLELVDNYQSTMNRKERVRQEIGLIDSISRRVEDVRDSRKERDTGDADRGSFPRLREGTPVCAVISDSDPNYFESLKSTAV